ncbi:MAG TPA: DNA replication/repair protein RecF [Candidatus Baltobacteraceae bacterium]|jgi:DNA replication and repair protein RecF|nr:DNA replication/repair protein RecF [Candidatus Baltobacteraceae bacterium]
MTGPVVSSGVHAGILNPLVVHLAHLRLRDFRNYRRLDADFTAGFHLLLGDNAQGKTNILEAIYLIATLRSFRGVGGAQMIRHGQKGYFIGATVLSRATHDIKIYWSARQRKLTLDSQPVRRLGDYLGTLRAVVFCTEDLQLIKGTPPLRRRFMDLLLTQTHPVYLPLLQRYTAALRSRNALLKDPRTDHAALEGFTRQLVEAGTQLMKFRQNLAPQVFPLARESHARVAGGNEPLELEYQPSVREDFAVELAQSRGREKIFRSTVLGPHRDDLHLRLAGKSAAKFASEGQKRSIAIALKMAQAEYLSTISGTPPVLLIDDIMGELDARRRAGFLPLLSRAQQARSQVFMTCTEENWPRELGRDLRRWEVKAGSFASIG